MDTTQFHTPAGIRVVSVTADEMRAVDRVAVDDVGLALLQMMENAGRTLASHVTSLAGEHALVVAGNGGNGGGGLACARHLVNHDLSVEIVLDRDPSELTGVTSRQFRILDEMGVPYSVGRYSFSEVRENSIIVDALIGYGLTGAVRSPAKPLIREMNLSPAPILSLDVPSGIDATTGEILGHAVNPQRTLTLALPKTGLSDRTDSLYLADIGIPRTVYDRLEIEYVNPFGPNPWIKLVH